MEKRVVIGGIIVVALIVAGILLFGNFGISEGNKEQISPSPQTSGDENPVVENGDASVNEETSSEPKIYNTEIASFSFQTKELVINVGDTVIWTNMDSVSHTLTSDSGSELDSDYLSNGESYTHTFTTVGTFNYHCIPHPNMKGKIVVE